MTDRRDNTTQALAQFRDGSREAGRQILPLVYEELRRLAGRYLRNQRPGHTLQPTALVHEAYLRLVNPDKAGPADRSHFVGLAARAMRSILVDHGRARMTAKRGGGFERIPLDDAVALFESKSTDLLELDQALKELADFDEQQSLIVELRFFGGLTIEETADVLGISERTVTRDWRCARAWLYQQLSSGSSRRPSESSDEA